MPVIFRATFPTLGSFITLPVLLWLWAPLMGHPGAGLVKLVGRFILLLGLALSFKAHWVGEGSLELGLGLFLRFFFLFCLFIFWGDRFVCLFGFFFWASPRDVIENCHIFFPSQNRICSVLISQMLVALNVCCKSCEKGDICPVASCFGKALIRKCSLESCTKQI